MTSRDPITLSEWVTVVGAVLAFVVAVVLFVAAVVLPVLWWAS